MTACRLAILLGVLVSLAHPARADEIVERGATLTLRSAAARALDENYDARIARLEVARAEDTVREARGAYLPQLTVAAQAGYSNRQNERFTALDENLSPKTYGLSNLANDPWLSVVFDQVLLDLADWRRLERDELEAEIATIREREYAERVAFDVVDRYAAVLRAAEVETAARDRADAARWLAEQTGQRVEAGRALESDGRFAALEVEQAELDLESASADLDRARDELWLSIEGGTTPRPFPPTAPIELPDAAVDEASDELLLRAPDLRILALQKHVYEKQIEAAQAERYPTLGLRGGYAHYGIKRFDNFKDEAYVFVGVEVPIFDGFQTSSEIAGARKGARVARLSYESAVAAKRVRVADLARRQALASERLALAVRRVEASVERRRLVDDRLLSARGELADAQATRETLHRDRIDLANLRAERARLWAALQRELGRLAETLGGPREAIDEGNAQ